jgi:lipoic acid synthetase
MIDRQLQIDNQNSTIGNRQSTISIVDCGLADYRTILEQQNQLCKKRQRGEIPDTILIVEHPPVITFGARQNANKLLTSREYLVKRNIDVVDTRRGGGVTAHNPGQLVVYPILNLQKLNFSVSEYIIKLEETSLQLLEQLGVHCQRRKGFPGLWVGRKKIASIGVQISKSVTRHGTAINIQNDLSIFDLFIPCGLEGTKMTSVLNETGKQHSMSDIKKKLSQLLAEHFSNELRTTGQERRELPPWLRRTLPAGKDYNRTENILSSLVINTICTHANCPNRGDCWSRGTATVLILGNICTRNCGFCSVPAGKPQPPDPTEPHRIAQMAKQMSLKYLVLTSVDRDDLPDGGAVHFRSCIDVIRQCRPDIKFEILTPDFRNCQAEALEILRDVLPFVFAHNIETVPSLYPTARAGGNYQLSLNLLRLAKEKYGGIRTKSSIMLGLGETDDEVEQVLKDLRGVGCDRITIGQYLKPSKNSLEVVQYVPPEKFNLWRHKAAELGFSWITSSPFARSSYLAEKETPS